MAFDYWQTLEENQFYHIYNRVGSGLKLFSDSRDYQNFLQKWFKYFHNYIDTYAYCLVPNHFHLLVRIKIPESHFFDAVKNEDSNAARMFNKNQLSLDEFLVDQLRRFMSSISLTHKHKYKREGALFSKKVKRIKLSHDPHILYILCYIHHNVIHHKLGNNFADWRFTSYNSYFSRTKTHLSKADLFSRIGGLEIFKTVHEAFRIEQKEYLESGLDYDQIL